jgi:uridine kinase
MKIIGICGGSGSGKTSIIRDIRRQFNEDQLCIISQDEYYRKREEQIRDEKGIQNFDLPYAIRSEEMIADISKLREGEKVSRIEYTYNNELKDPQTVFYQPAPVLIIEGLFIFHFEEIREMCDLKIFVHAEKKLMLDRRIKRDRTERNYPLEDVLYRFEHHVLPAFKKYIKPYKKESDLVIVNNTRYDPGLNVLCGYIRDFLSKN